MFTSAVIATSHHSSLLSGLARWFMHGLAFRAGSRIASHIPFLLLIVIIAIIGGIWLYKRHH